MKPLLVAMFVLLAGGVARSEPVNCEALKSSYEPYQVIRVIHIDGVLDADHTSVYRDPSGRNLAISTRADGSSTSKTTSYGMFAVVKEDPSNKSATVRYEYAGINPQQFALDAPAAYTLTQVTADGRKAVLKVEYTFVGRKTFALETCQFDVIQYTSRSSNPSDGQEVSFVEGEYSPDLKLVLSSKTRLTTAGKQISLLIAARKLYVGEANFVPAGKAQAPSRPSPQASTGSSPREFSLGSSWNYIQAAVAPGRIFAHGQADIADESGTMLGGIGFYCALPHSYIDIFVHKPGGAIGDYYWGDATFKTSLDLDGVKMPATVERGIIYVDIGDDIRPVLDKAFEVKPGAPARRLNADVANFAKFGLVIKASAPPATSATEQVSFARMESLCDATIAAQSRGK